MNVGWGYFLSSLPPRLSPLSSFFPNCSVERCFCAGFLLRPALLGRECLCNSAELIWSKDKGGNDVLGVEEALRLAPLKPKSGELCKIRQSHIADVVEVTAGTEVV